MRYFRTLLNVFASHIIVLSSMMIPSAILEFFEGHGNRAFFLSSTITLCIGIILLIFGKKGKVFRNKSTNNILLVSSLWFFTCVLACIPFTLSGYGLADSLFESTSSITATGATIIAKPELIDKSMLLWRALLHLIGGLGIIMTISAIIPLSDETSSMNLTMLELNLHAVHGGMYKLNTKSIIVSYISLFLLCAVLYRTFGMNTFDSLCHAMSTIATGGLMNYSDSFAHYSDHAALEYIAEAFMLIGALPCAAYPCNVKAIGEQVYCMLIVVIIGSILVSLSLSQEQLLSTVELIRVSLFSIISAVSTTGFSNFDYSVNGTFSLIIIVCSTIGGCAISTSGGIKVDRILFMLKVIKGKIAHELDPRVNSDKYTKINNLHIQVKAWKNISSYIFVYLVTLVLIALTLSFENTDFTTIISGTTSILANFGPGIGPTIGPSGNYSTLDPWGKILLSVSMLLGKLEIISLLILASQPIKILLKNNH